MKKKVKIFGKGIPVFAIVLVAILGIASATLISYFGIITGNVGVDQGLFLDDKAWNDDSITYNANLTSLEEKTISSGNHFLKNTADVAAEVKLDTICTKAGPGDCSEPTTIPVFELSITGVTGLPGQGIGITDQDRVTANGGTLTLGDISNLSFDYNLTTTTNGLSPYFVLALDTNNDEVADKYAVSMQGNGVGGNIWLNHGSSLLFHIPGDATCTQASPCDLGIVKTQIGNSAKLLQVKVMIGYWGDAHPTTALVKNINVNSADIVKNNGLFVRQKDSTDPNDMTWGDNIVDFSIETHFPKMMMPGTYTITTKVVPA